MDTIEIPDATTERLRTAREDIAQAEQRWQDLAHTACEMAGVDPQTAQLDLQSGTIQVPETDE